MQDSDKTQEELIQELETLRRRVAELEVVEMVHEQAQAALEELGKQNSNLFELAGDSVFVVEPTTLRILDANANAARRLGYSREELLQLSLDDIETLDVDSPESAVAWESRFSRTSVYECKHRRNDGTEIPVEVSSRIVRRDQQAVLLNFARDISKRKQLEAEREQLIVELDAYAHTVAHDLKSPLSILLGYSNMLMDFSSGASEEEIQEWVGTLHKIGRKMHNIIDELLLLASVRKMEDINQEFLDMRVIVGEALGRLTNVIAEAGVEVITPDVWPQALGYPSCVEEIWVNYISNAIKYGGTPPLVEVGGTPEGDGMVRFWVRDNGPGILPEEQARLFDQFTRLDKTRAEGHGLGLSIVQRIVEKLGGEVGVESRIAEGSTFSFTLPAPG
jgi:PAS domain S-box-containing protein